MSGLAVGEVAPVEEALAQRLVAGAQGGVHHQQCLEPVGHGHRQREADQPAPILHDQHDVAQVERLDEVDQAAAVEIERVGLVVDRLVRAAEAREIGRDHAMPGDREYRHHAAIEVAPGRLAVQAEPGPGRPARAGIDVVQAQTVGSLVVEGRIGPAVQILETVIGRAQSLNQWCILRT